MTAASDLVRKFFEQYERSRNTLDVGLISSQYPASFMFADPNGARVVEKQTVLATLPKGQEFLKGLGHKSTRVVSVDESRLDEHYALVRVRFLWHFEKEPAPAVDVSIDATFILFIKDGAAQIVFQQEQEEFQQALRRHGVLPQA